MPQQKIDQFIDQVLEEAKLTSLPEDFGPKYRQKIQEEVEYRLLKTILRSLPDSKLDQFKGLAKKGESSAEELEKFLNENVKNYPQVINEELEKFKKVFVDKIAALKK